MNNFGIVVVAAGVIALGGCAGPSAQKIEKRAGLEGVPEGQYTAAIRAAAVTDFSQDRREVLEDVAARPDLCESDQRRILAVLRAKPGFSDDNAAVLVALARNDATTHGTRVEIGNTLQKMVSFSDDRQKVAAALAR